MVIEPTLLVRNDEIQTALFADLMKNMRNSRQSSGDFIAQIAANRRGLKRLWMLVDKMGRAAYLQALDDLNAYATTLAGSSLKDIPDGEYEFVDVLDDDGQGHNDIRIRIKLVFRQGKITADFSGTSPQVGGNINCPLSVTAAAVYYVFRCLMPPQTPACAGSFDHITLFAPEHTVVNASFPAAVAAGNVETSTRIVDVVLGALSKAIPERIPAASHGSMNNLAMGSVGDADHPAWDYYETIGGGMGASIHSDGCDGVQTHMTNTLNTPVESLEMNYPLRVKRYALRPDSGGQGQHAGGSGITREFEFLQDAVFTLLSERRIHAPWGLSGGEAAAVGENVLNGEKLPGKVSRKVKAGDVLIVSSAGGGGYGEV
jgi:N-methylhydantoinase B